MDNFYNSSHSNYILHQLNPIIILKEKKLISKRNSIEKPANFCRVGFFEILLFWHCVSVCFVFFFVSLAGRENKTYYMKIYEFY